jgi:hypothetical protein
MFTISNPVCFIPDMYYYKKPDDADFIKKSSHFHACGQAGMSVHFTRVSCEHSDYFFTRVATKLNESYKSITFGVISFGF